MDLNLRMIKILSAIAIIMWIIMIWYSIVLRSGFDSIIVGAYFTVVGLLSGFVFAEMGKRFYDDKHKDLLTQIKQIQKSQRMIDSRLIAIESKLDELSSKLNYYDNGT